MTALPEKAGVLAEFIDCEVVALDALLDSGLSLVLGVPMKLVDIVVDPGDVIAELVDDAIDELSDQLTVLEVTNNVAADTLLDMGNPETAELATDDSEE